MIYAGFGGVYRTVKWAMKYNRLDLPLFDNLRNGAWLVETAIDKYSKKPQLKTLVGYLDNALKLMKDLPRH